MLQIKIMQRKTYKYIEGIVSTNEINLLRKKYFNQK